MSISNASKKETLLKNFLVKEDSYFPFLLMIITCLVYYITLLPGVGYSGDSSKFQFLGKILGTPHPPGYPNYLILNYIFVTLFPFGSLAFKANFLSSIFTIASTFPMYKSFRLMNIRPIIAFSVILTFCFGKTVWNQSLVAEVYSLNLLYVSLVTYYFIRWNIYQRDRDFFLACFIYAISFGNHLLMINLFPSIVYLVLATNKKVFLNPIKILLVSLFIILGAVQYGYLYWRTLSPGTLYLETRVYDLKSLIEVVTESGYKPAFFLKVSIIQTIAKIKKFGFFYIRELLILLPLPIIGFLAKKDRVIKIFLILGFSVNLLFSFFFNIDEIWVYLIPSYFFLSFFISFAIEWGVVRFSRLLKPRVLFLILIIPLFFLAFNFQRNNMSRDTQLKDFTEQILETIQSNALIVKPGYDEFECLNYYLLGEGYGAKNNVQLISLDEVNLFRENWKIYPSRSVPIYILEDTQVEDLQNQGYQVKIVYDKLYRIDIVTR